MKSVGRVVAEVDNKTAFGRKFEYLVTGKEDGFIPIELYKQDNVEYRDIRNLEQALKAYSEKGGLSIFIYPDNVKRVDLVTLRAQGFGETGKNLSSSLLLLLAMLRESMAANSPQSDQPLSHEQLVALTGAAIERWIEVVGTLPDIDLEVSIQSLPDGELGYAQITDYTNGLPTAAVIVVDDDGAGFGWFVDPTPLDDEEFDGRLRASDGGGAEGFDLLTVLSHELGHVLGFTDDLPGFEVNVTYDNGGRATYRTPLGIAYLTGDLDHLDISAHPDSLMNYILASGVRKLPSALEAAILQQAWEDSLWARGSFSYSINYLHSVDHLDPHTRFVLFSDAIVEDLQNGAPTGIQDGGFDVVDSPDWNQFGAVDVSSGAATLTEGSLLFSDVSQVFEIPTGAESLKFTISGLDLRANDNNPPDAFEIALLDAVDVTPLAKVAGLSHTDALLNIQADGTVFLAPGVSILGDVSSGTFDVVISLAGAQAGDPVALFFDLVRFGAAESSVTIDGVSVESVTTTNPEAPVVDAGDATAQIDEGDTFTRSGTFTDANGADTYTATVDYGDGSGSQSLTLSAGTYALNHTYTQNGLHSIMGSITDGTGLVGTDTILVTVLNVAPVVDAGADLGVELGAAALVTATFADPGLADSHTASIDWGDGTIQSVAVDQVAKTLAGSHEYAAEGNYTVTITVFDNDGGSGTDSILVSVIFVAPQVSALGPGVVSEGGLYQLQLLANGASASQITGWVVDWGDGTIDEIPGQASQATHTFAQGPNDFVIKAFARIGPTQYDANSVAVTVLNRTPALGLVTIDPVIDEGGVATISAAFVDGGLSDRHTVTVNWGDGVVQQILLPSGDRTFTIAHQFLDNLPGDAPYPVQLTLSDDSGAQSVRTLQVVVRNLAPVTTVTIPTRAVRGVPLSFSSQVSDPSGSDLVEVFWDFGDGTTLPYRSISDTSVLRPSHTYTTPGSYTVSMTARDSDGAVTVSTALLTVFPPTAGHPAGGGRSTDGSSARAADSLAGTDFFTAAADSRLVAFLTVDSWVKERGRAWLLEVAASPVLELQFDFGSPGFLTWDSLYDRSGAGWIDAEHVGFESLQVVETGHQFSQAKGGGEATVTLRFSRDVGPELSAGDLLVGEGERGDFKVVSFHYDAKSFTGHWTLRGSKVPAGGEGGSIKVSLPEDSVRDADGALLDGDADGEPGGAFMMEIPLRAE